MKDYERMIKDWKPTRIHFGDGSIQGVGGVVKNYSDRVLLIVGQGALRKNGILDRVGKSLEDASVSYQLCEGVEPNPSKETVYRIAYHLLAGGFGCMLAVGGGSVLDAAKAAGILATLKTGEIDQYFGVGMVSRLTGRIMPLIVAPTTSGSGSEVTKFSVITDMRLGVKKLIIDAALVPREAFVDPELTHSCSRHVTIVSGLDAMTHLIEGYFNQVDDGADPRANERALTGLSVLFDALPRAADNPGDRSARTAMSAASLLGGTVLYYKQAGGPHLNSFSWCNVMDHGEACAVMLPYYGAYYAPVLSEKMERVSEIMGSAGSGNPAKDFAEGLLAFYKKLGFPLTLKEFKTFTPELIDKAVRDASQNKMKLEAMPRPIPQDKSNLILRTIIEGAYKGSLEDILKL